MALAIFWSKKADKRFDSIIDYLNDSFGAHSTSIFVKKIYEFLDVLKDFPEIGSIENSELNIRGFVILKQITIFYQVRDNTIVIINFYDKRQNPKKKKY